MSTAPKQNPVIRTQAPSVTPATAAATSAYTRPAKPVSTSDEPRGNQTFLFDRSNYVWMLGGLACILLGFILMSGGKSPDPHQFNYAEIYSFRRITLAPILILIGFAIEAYAIMKRPAALADDREATTVVTTA